MLFKKITSILSVLSLAACASGGSSSLPVTPLDQARIIQKIEIFYVPEKNGVIQKAGTTSNATIMTVSALLGPIGLLAGAATTAGLNYKINSDLAGKTAQFNQAIKQRVGTDDSSLNMANELATQLRQKGKDVKVTAYEPRADDGSFTDLLEKIKSQGAPSLDNNAASTDASTSTSTAGSTNSSTTEELASAALSTAKQSGAGQAVTQSITSKASQAIAGSVIDTVAGSLGSAVRGLIGQHVSDAVGQSVDKAGNYASQKLAGSADNTARRLPLSAGYAPLLLSTVTAYSSEDLLSAYTPYVMVNYALLSPDVQSLVFQNSVLKTPELPSYASFGDLIQNVIEARSALINYEEMVVSQILKQAAFQ